MVSLDPVRLVALECYLRGLVDGCRNRAADIEEALFGTGESASAEVGELRRLAEWSGVNADGVAFRRAIIEALPRALPRPDLVFASPEVGASRGRALGGRILRALEDEPPEWGVISRLLAEVGRGDHEPAFVDAVRHALGPEVLLRLPGVLGASAGAAALPDGDQDPAVLAALAAVRTVCASVPAASLDPDSVPTHGGAPSASLMWAAVRGAGMDLDDAQISEVERAAEDIGFGADVARGLGGLGRTLLRAGRKAGSMTPLAGAGLVLDVADLVDDPDAKDVLALVADGLLAAAPFSGSGAPFLYAAGAVVAIAGFALGRPWDLDDDDRDVRRDDSGTGGAVYPSGSPRNPNVGTAGVPLPPGYA